MGDLLAQLTRECTRPRYCFMLLTLLARVSNAQGAAGPYVRQDDRAIPIRNWLCEALIPLAQRDPRRAALEERVRDELIVEQGLRDNPATVDAAVAAEVRRRVRRSGLSNVSRAISELVHAGLVRRHYAGYRVDHHNRGGQRQAVYTLAPEVLAALA